MLGQQLQEFLGRLCSGCFAELVEGETHACTGEVDPEMADTARLLVEQRQAAVDHLHARELRRRLIADRSTTRRRIVIH